MKEWNEGYTWWLFEKERGCLKYSVFYSCEDTPWPRQLLQKKAFNWGLLTVWEGLIHDIIVGNMAGKHGCWRSSWELFCRQQVERKADRQTRGERQTQTGPDIGFWILNAHSQPRTSSNKDIPPNPFQTAHQLGPKHVILSQTTTGFKMQCASSEASCLLPSLYVSSEGVLYSLRHHGVGGVGGQVVPCSCGGQRTTVQELVLSFHSGIPALNSGCQAHPFYPLSHLPGPLLS